jgi:hypothetical protein
VLSDEQLTALMTEVHKEIEEAAVKASAALGPEGHPDVVYPPNAGLTQEEREALAAVEANPALVSGVRKLVATAASSPLFALFTMLDGVADPAGIDEWPVWELTPSEDGEELHDRFYDTYWAWRELRPDPGWRLDTYSGPPPRVD